jgi:hypothetical protein
LGQGTQPEIAPPLPNKKIAQFTVDWWRNLVLIDGLGIPWAHSGNNANFKHHGIIQAANQPGLVAQEGEFMDHEGRDWAHRCFQPAPASAGRSSQYRTRCKPILSLFRWNSQGYPRLQAAPFQDSAS